MDWPPIVNSTQTVNYKINDAADLETSETIKGFNLLSGTSPYYYNG